MFVLTSRGSGMRTGGHVFPQLPSYLFYQLIQLMIWFSCPHKNIKCFLATCLNQSTKRPSSVGVHSLWVGSGSPGVETHYDQHGPQEKQEAACLAVLQIQVSLSTPPHAATHLPQLVLNQPLTQACCYPQSWQHVCVECTLAIYGHTHTVNKSWRASTHVSVLKLVRSDMI